jgi:hypothetical protein
MDRRESISHVAKAERIAFESMCSAWSAAFRDKWFPACWSSSPKFGERHSVGFLFRASRKERLALLSQAKMITRGVTEFLAWKASDPSEQPVWFREGAADWDVMIEVINSRIAEPEFYEGRKLLDWGGDCQILPAPALAKAKEVQAMLNNEQAETHKAK